MIDVLAMNNRGNLGVFIAQPHKIYAEFQYIVVQLI